MVRINPAYLTSLPQQDAADLEEDRNRYVQNVRLDPSGSYSRTAEDIMFADTLEDVRELYTAGVTAATQLLEADLYTAAQNLLADLNDAVMTWVGSREI